MSKAKKDIRTGISQRPFRLVHQTLCITAFNFDRQSLLGYVELTVHPIRTDLRKIKLNSKQCRIYRVSINEQWEAPFLYNDPTLEICQQDGKKRDLEYFESCHFTAMQTVDADLGNGELMVRIPQEAHAIVQELRPFRVCIEFSLEYPQGGIKFVLPDMDGTMLERGAHCFTYGHENSSRLWFPCVDSYSEVCTWKLEFTVDMYLTAVSCGDLIETVYTPDLRKKTYHYYLSVPTAAPNIALAVGPFEVFVDPNMHEVTHFCLPHLLPVLRHSTAFLHDAFEFYEELLSSRFPYSCYKQVFVDQAYKESSTYATMTIFSTNLLFAPKVIDQVPESRKVMAGAIAHQFFGCFISMNSWCDAWLPKGIASYLTGLYIRKALGNNEYRHLVAEELKAVEEYESQVAGIVLDPSQMRDSGMYFPTKHPHTISSVYADIFNKKAHLIIRMLELRLGRELLLQGLNKLLALASNAAIQRYSSNTWSNMLISTDSFLKGISTVTGKDIQTFLEQWVHQSGCARFHCSFVFNRKRNAVELELKQDMTARGSMKYVGPLTVTIQELDGSFNHTFKIEENKTKFDITCHSKSRRNKKKKIPLMTGEEVDMDLNAMDADSPVLWLRVDPDMQILREVTIEQPDFMWQYQLRYERCVVAQSEAIIALEKYPTQATRLALTDTIQNEKCFYKVRMEAALCLAKVANVMAASWAGPPAMMTIFKKFFGSHSCPHIVKQNNFKNFQHYHLQKIIPIAMAKLRTIHGICPPEVLRFLLDLFKYNDNTRNKYSDNYYRASLIQALAETVTPAVTPVVVTGQAPSTDFLSADTKLILEEITRCLNLEKLLPSYKLTVTVSCLQAIRVLQKFGHVPSEPDIFKSYATHGNFLDVRLAAYEALVDYVKVEQKSESMMWLFSTVEEDPEVFVRHRVLQMMAKAQLFNSRERSVLNTESLVERLWGLMNSSFAHDARLRCDVADLYYSLYGSKRPSCLPASDSALVLNIKQGRTIVQQPSVKEDLGPMPFPSESSHQSGIHSMPMDTFTDISMSHGLKRKADSPLHFNMSTESIIEPGTELPPVIMSEDSDVKFKSSVELKGQLISEPSQHSQPPTAAAVVEEQEVPLPISNEPFPNYGGEQIMVTQTPIVKEEKPPVLRPQMSVLAERTCESDSVSRLSEDSDSGPPHLADSSKSQAERVSGPTSFHPSMFRPMSAEAQYTQPLGVSSVLASREPESSRSKKKKKKKKAKHKHKSDKHERDRPDLIMKINKADYSSETSTVNSPLIARTPPSSPE